MPAYALGCTGMLSDEQECGVDYEHTPRPGFEECQECGEHLTTRTLTRIKQIVPVDMEDDREALRSVLQLLMERMLREGELVPDSPAFEPSLMDAYEFRTVEDVIHDTKAGIVTGVVQGARTP